VLAGLAPAGMAASLAAPDPYVRNSRIRLPPRVFYGEPLMWPIARPTDGEPPLADAVDRKRGRVMVHPDTRPSGIAGKIVDVIRYRATEFLDQEVMDPDLFRVALRAILMPVITEIADQFFFRGVDGDHRQLFGQSRSHLTVDVVELRIRSGWLSPSVILRLPCKL
jgi:hypothetical protein